jgi:effector-binding domain-containing protein
MKKYKSLLIWALGILAILLLVGFLLPGSYKVERSSYIKSKPEMIFMLTSNFSLWHTWAPWTKEEDSTMVLEVTGESGKVGSIWKWNGEEFGNGEMLLTETKPGELVGYDLAFDHGKHTSKGKFLIEQEGDSVKVTWRDEGNLGYSPFNRYMGLVMDKMMGPDFEKGLAKLKIVAEARRNWPPIDEVIIPQQTALVVLDSAGPKEYQQVMGRAYADLYDYLKSASLKQKGNPIAIYLSWDSVTLFSVMKIAIPIEKAEKGKGRVKVEQLPETKGVRAIYFGDYSKMGPAYWALGTYIKETAKTETGGPWEIYQTSPMMEKDTAKWETHIIFPVK